MKTLHFLLAMFLTVSVSAQHTADDILASNDLNTGKSQQTLLLSEFSDDESVELDGIYKLLADNGQLKEVRSFDHGALDGTWLEYDNEGKLIALANYKNNAKHGKWVIWDSKGTKRYELFYSEGERSGTWKSWDEEGKLSSTKEY